jgi:cell division protein FtsQ
LGIFKKSADDRSRRDDRLKRRRWHGAFLSLGLLAVVGASGFAGYHSGAIGKARDRLASGVLSRTAAAGFKVSNIIVTGRRRIPAAELLERLDIKDGAPIFTVDIAEAQQSLTGISWVKEAVVSRRLPDTITVDLKERQPAALWQHQKKVSLIDSGGVVLTAQNLEDYRQLPLVVGKDAPQHLSALLAPLNAEPKIAQALASAVRIGDHRWDLRLKNGISVKLPKKDMELAFRRLAAAEEKNGVFGKDIASIDLRQPDRMVVAPLAANDIGTDKKNKKSGT